MLFISAVVSSGPRVFVSSRTRRPCRRTHGGWPVVMCKSLAPSLTTVSSSLSIWIVGIQFSPLRTRGHYWHAGFETPLSEGMSLGRNAELTGLYGRLDVSFLSLR